MNARNHRLFCLILLVASAAPALAQPTPTDPERKYVQFPIDKNAAEIIKNRLKVAQDLGPLKEIIQQVINNPQGMNADLLKKLPDLKLEDKKVKQSLLDMLQNDPAFTNELTEWIKKSKNSKQTAETMKSLNDLEHALDDVKKQPAKAAAETQASKPKEEAKADQAITKTVQDGMEKLEKSPLGHWVRDSPAWQQAIQDLRTSLENPQAAKWNPGDWARKLLTPDGKTSTLAESALERIKNMPKPDLERWNLKLSLAGLGNIPTPNLNMPSAPDIGSPSMPSLSVGATWILLAALSLLVGWQMSRWSKRPAISVDWRASLGPWPIKPDEVATRSDLVRAFDYLAILTLGLDARSWNHQAIARRWCANSAAHAPSADTLARLYEQARYTDGPSELAPPQRDRARQSLQQLAEVH